MIWFHSAAACPLSLQNDPSSVSILRSTAKVSPEPVTPTLVSEPELATRCVFGVTLETLREAGQMVGGIPFVLRDMVEFLDKNGNFVTLVSWRICYSNLFLSQTSLLPSLKHHLYVFRLDLLVSFPTGIEHRGLFRLCGSVVRTRQLRQRWDSGERVDLEHEQDVPTVASLLKLFFRELPTPIIPEPERKQLVLSLRGTQKSCWTDNVGIKLSVYM